MFFKDKNAQKYTLNSMELSKNFVRIYLQHYFNKAAQLSNKY